MERQFNNGDFEKLLRDNANQYRMYPSEKVWKGIHSALHTRRRWYGITAAVLFLVTSSVVSIFIFNGDNGPAVLTEQKDVAEKSNLVNNNSITQKSNQFTPGIQKTENNNSSLTDITKSYIRNPLYDMPVANEEKDVISKLNSSVTNINTGIIEPDIRSDELAVLFNEQLPVDFRIETSSTKAEIQQQQNIDANKDRDIRDQNSVDGDTEKKINDAISALASQNASLIPKPRRARVTGQVYFTPTVSYRKLSENKNIYNNSGYYVPTIDVKNLVKHKPAMGLEFGFEGRFEVNEKFFLKSGLQFNISRYDIQAYSYPTEIATVALSNGYHVDSLAALTNYRNYRGSSPSANWLENFYFQVGIPIGADIILSDKNNFQWGISGTIQPTYVLGDRAYVISSDYKNYAKFPNLIRRWNISTGVGTFVSYSTGKIRWQVGPHVRYQHLSSFVSALSVKENLFAVGFKIGASLNNFKQNK